MIPDDLARARPADLRRGATAGCPQTLRPLHNARRCHLQRHGHLPDTLPFGPPRQRAFAVKGGVNLDHFGGAKVDQLVKG